MEIDCRFARIQYEDRREGLTFGPSIDLAPHDATRDCAADLAGCFRPCSRNRLIAIGDRALQLELIIVARAALPQQEIRTAVGEAIGRPATNALLSSVR